MAKTYRNIKHDLDGRADWKAVQVKRNRKKHRTYRQQRLTMRVAVAMSEQD